MSDDEFRAKLKEAKNIVQNWPDWKKSALENSFKASNSGPREPVGDEIVGNATAIKSGSTSGADNS